MNDEVVKYMFNNYAKMSINEKINKKLISKDRLYSLGIINGNISVLIETINFGIIFIE